MQYTHSEMRRQLEAFMMKNTKQSLISDVPPGQIVANYSAIMLLSKGRQAIIKAYSTCRGEYADTTA